MSFLSTVEGWFEKFGSAFMKMFKKAPTVEHAVIAFVDLAAPAVEAIVAAVDPVVLPIITPVVTVIESKLATLTTITSNVQTAPAGSSFTTELQTVLGDISSAVGSILNLAGVKNSAKVTTIEAEVNGITGALNGLIQNLPSLSSLIPPAAPGNSANPTPAA